MDDLSNKAEKEMFFIDMVERMERYKAYNECKTDKEAWLGYMDLCTTNMQDALVDDMQDFVDAYSERIVWIKNHIAQM